MKPVIRIARTAAGLIVILLTGCDNVSWGGVDVAVVPPPPKAVAVTEETEQAGVEPLPTDPILSVENLRLQLRGDPPVTLVDGVSFALRPQRILGIVGESGCGKSVTALSILRLAGPAIRATGRVKEGQIIMLVAFGGGLTWAASLWQV